ncbi:hypothetical protein Vretimale_13736 [Volvox reticuliferus]|uniref:Uncharacterized protein n=1 Tax=Volvox reticuliferus TaxID=1737510 RepID=A0A8J4GM17_9CHLO|nr:hypothetical protein Vretifemale_14678 [Volvox reticuliferus]GIM09952.1 hypothetical protein Vretimale_13736 [Volvox reticuliferus]
MDSMVVDAATAAAPTLQQEAAVAGAATAAAQTKPVAPSADQAVDMDTTTAPKHTSDASPVATEPADKAGATSEGPSLSPSPAPGSGSDRPAPAAAGPGIAAPAPAPAAAAVTAPAPAAAPAVYAPAGRTRRSSAPAEEEASLPLQRKQRLRRPPAGWEMDNDPTLPAKRVKIEQPGGSEASPPTGVGAAVNGSAIGINAVGGSTLLSGGGIPYGALFFRAQGRNPNLLVAFDGSFARPLLCKENAVGVEPTMLTQQEAAAEGPPEYLKCLGFARQDGSGAASGMRLASLGEVTSHFRAVLDPSSPTYGKPSAPTVYVIITCDKSRGWMSYEIDVNGNVCPKVVYEGEGGLLQSTTPAQFEAAIAQSSAKKWRHSFKAAGGFLKMGPRQGGVMPPATVLDVLSCVKDLLGVSPAVTLPSDKPLTQQQRRAAAAAAEAAATAAGTLVGGGSRSGTPGANGGPLTKQEQRREQERGREKERAKEQLATMAADGAAHGMVAAGRAVAKAFAAGGTQDKNKQLGLPLPLHSLGEEGITRPAETAAATHDDTGKTPLANGGTTAAGRAGKILLKSNRAGQVAAAAAGARGAGTANGSRGGGGGSLPAAMDSQPPSSGALAAPAATSNAAVGSGGGGNVTPFQMEKAASLATVLTNALAPLIPDVNGLSLSGPGLTTSEAQAIQLVCTSIKGPDLAFAVKGIMESLAVRPTASAAAAATVMLLAMPPGAVLAPSPGSSIAYGDGGCSPHIPIAETIAPVPVAVLPALPAPNVVEDTTTAPPQTLPAADGVAPASTVAATGQASPPTQTDQGRKEAALPASPEVLGGSANAGVTATPAAAAGASPSPASQQQPTANGPAASADMDVDGVKIASSNGNTDT